MKETEGSIRLKCLIKSGFRRMPAKGAIV